MSKDKRARFRILTVGTSLIVVILAVALASPRLTAQSQSDQAWKVLRNGLSSTSAETRVKAIRAMDLLVKNPEAEKILIAALKDKNSDVQVAAVITLGNIGTSTAAAEIRKLVPTAGAELIFAAANALYKLNDPGAYEIFYAAVTKEKKSGEGLVESQMKMLHNPKAMAKVGFEAGIGFVPFGGLGYGAFKVVTKDDESPVRAAAALKLATDKDPKSAKALANAASDEKWLVRAAAIAAIGMRGDASLLSAVTPKLEDKNDTVRFNAAACIIRLSK